MLLSIFSSLYEVIIGENADFPEYRDGIFDSVGLITIFIAIAFCLLFYIVLGRWKEIWYTTLHWAVTIIIVAAVCFGFAFYQAKGQLGDFDSYLIRFSIINIFWGCIIFIFLSFGLKHFSIYARKTPF